MRTEELIALLAADAAPRPDPARHLGPWLAGGLAVAVLAMVAALGLRPDLPAALASPVLAKTVAPLVLGLLALAQARRLARPEADGRPGWLAIGGLAAAAAAALVAALAAGGTAGLAAALADRALVVTCLVSVPLMAALPLAALLWHLSRGAPAAPGRAGLAAGLAAAGLATAAYSLHCPGDAALFALPVYGVVILAVAAAGAAAGARLLRW